MTANQVWWKAGKGDANREVFRTVREIDARQSATFMRMVKLEALYDPNNAAATSMYARDQTMQNVTENLAASNVDTVAAAIATVDVDPRIQTKDADWSTQRTAKRLEWYSEALMDTYGVMGAAQTAFREAEKKGSGWIAAMERPGARLICQPVMADDVYVDDLETRALGKPRQLHWRKPNVSKDELIAEFPDFEQEIMNAGRQMVDTFRRGNRGPSAEHEVVEVESWYRPVGAKGTKGYRAGRHTRCVDGKDLVDEEWTEDEFPIARVVWEERAGSVYGISLVERIAGHQRVVNKRHWQIDKTLDLMANPTTYVSMVDANLAVKTTNEIGTVVPIKGERPTTIAPQPVSGQVFEHLDMISERAFNESGVSRLAAQSYKPAGLDSGRALREYRDQTTQRFAPQEKRFERFVLDVVLLLIGACKRLGDAAPKMLRRTRFGSRKIEWKDVDLGDVKIQLAAASTLQDTPAGREQTVLEWAQAGVISQEEARRLISHPDLERALSLYTAALENVEHSLEMIADGGLVVPEPFMNLKMCVWRGQMQYLIWRDDGAPEDVLERVRQFVVTAAWLLSQQGAANANTPMPAPGAMPMPGQAAPPAGTPQAAFAPSAAQAVA